MKKEHAKHAIIFNERVRAFIACLVSAVLVFSLSGCTSDDPVISEGRQGRVKVLVNETDCNVDDDSTAAALDGEIGDMETNAKKTYYVLKEMGYADENIAGVLGNWNTESSLDPTGVETIFDEPFNMGPKKTAAMKDPQSFTLNTVFPAYAGKVKINKEAYKGDDDKYYPGIGLAGFTGPATTRLLKYAEKHNMPWYSFDLQLSFSITEDEGGYGRGEFWKNWEKESSCESAAETFLAKYEGCPGMMLAERQKHAREWMEKIKTWSPDSSYAKSIINLGEGKSSTAKKPTATTKSGNTKATTDAGDKIDIPDEYDNIQENHGWGGGYKCLVEGVRTGNEGWWVCWKEYEGPQGDVARKWVEQGQQYASGSDLPIIDGRVGVAVKIKFGSPGDYIDIAYKDGNLLHAIILDTQGASDDAGGVAAWSDYGHNTAGQRCNVLEWYTDGDGGLVGSGHSDPCNVSGFEWVTGTVDYIINTHGVNTGSAVDGTNAVTDEACDDAAGESGVDVAAGEAAAVEESTTARLEWLYGDAGVPTNESDNAQYLEEFDVVIRKPDGSKGTWKLTMHKKLKTEVQAMFQDIYNNTDYTIDPSDGNSLRPWDSEAGRFSAPQTNSNHAYGLAIDINVAHNNGTGSCDVGTTYNPGSDPLSFSEDHKVVQIMKKHGFFWGGSWTSVKDPMHFAYTNH